VSTGFWRGKPEEKRPFGRHRHRWEDNIQIDVQEVVCGVMDWIYLVQVASICEPSGALKCGEFLD